MPEPRSLLLLRHGRTAWNAEKRIQGQLDVPLDPTGEAQAKTVAEVLAGFSPSFVRSSDLSRARATAEVVAAAAGLEVEPDPRLREFDLGERSGWSHEEYRARHPEEFARFRVGEYDAAPGGEPVPVLLARTLPALDEAMGAVPEGGLGVVVSHGAALRVSVAEWLGLPRGAGLSFAPLGNCHWALLQAAVEGDAPASGRRLLAWNRHA
ncbi:histidine phosphatase family protein [Nocardioides solisilvae]|uniref:histidine phosphatase family protein n=1 Tax=Nocardioides solisilvae TaxID=1542435 RepID=UPI000D747D0D|nr:histidine phosphatase family protein [Nocardioides solisilvae]